MKSKDAIRQAMMDAIKNGDQKAFDGAYEEWCNSVEENVLDRAQAKISELDNQVLQNRGSNVLTNEETGYFNEIINALRQTNPRDALTDVQTTMPETEINRVFEDMLNEHPLLQAINFQVVNGKVKMPVATGDNAAAARGALATKISKELSASFKEIDITLVKITAFMYVSNDMLDLGPVWLEQYVRGCLAEAIALSLEDGVINADGKDDFIGMTRSVKTGVTMTDGAYPLKDVTTITDLTPKTFGDLASKLAINERTSKYRTVDHLIMVVNPVDYYKTIYPATTVVNVAGQVINNVTGYPVTFIPSAAMAQGKAAFGIATKYIGFIGTGDSKEGKIEVSDQYKFLEDDSTYKIKLHGYGLQADDNAFLYLDISALKPLFITVKQTTDSAG